MTVDQINEAVKASGEAGSVSDGYHTFDELYEHRISLFIALCYAISSLLTYDQCPIWKSKKHSDNSEWDGWFIMGIGIANGEQITYHLPASKWESCSFAHELDKAPDFDGHTSDDVLTRLSKLYAIK